MPEPRRIRPAQVLVLVLVLAPLWKLAEPLVRRGPRPIDDQAARGGRELFLREWTVADPLTGGDGLGPVYNATSCVACHDLGGVGGAGRVDRNVTVYALLEPHPRGLPSSGIVHRLATEPGFQETLRLVHPSLPATPTLGPPFMNERSRPRFPGVVVSQRNPLALFGAGLIDTIPDSAILAHQREHSTTARLLGLDRATDRQVKGRAARLSDGRLGRFGRKLEFATLNEFVREACAQELGLSSPGRPQAISLARPGDRGKGTDLTEEQCRMLVEYVRSLPPPRQAVTAELPQAAEVAAGKRLFHLIGCADCHTESLGGVDGIYSDLLLHELGAELESGPGYYGPGAAAAIARAQRQDPPAPGEWRTAPLWGVADSAPYLHDGRAPTLEDAIRAHRGEASAVTDRFLELSPIERRSLIGFLESLRGPVAEPFPPPRGEMAAR